MSDAIIDALRTAVGACAETFDGRGSAIRERDLEMALEAILRALGHKPMRQVKVRLEKAWSGRVGGVDLAIEAGAGDGFCLIELKWDPKSLAACAWDSVKLAAALQAGEGCRAFLIAGSPVVDGLRGDCLLEDADVWPERLRREFATEFDFWRRDVENHPLFAPAAWRTRRLESAPLLFKGEPWRIRLAELMLKRGALVPFEEAA
jgi:hypothetical protein